MGVNKLSRNVTIVVIILIIVLLAAYLVWLRGKYSAEPILSPSPNPTVQASPSLEPSPTVSASASATPVASPKEATKSGSKTIKTATPAATVR